MNIFHLLDRVCCVNLNFGLMILWQPFIFGLWNVLRPPVFCALTSQLIRYTQNGILHMLDRNKRIKTKPERFQSCKDKFDLVITCEERVYDQVLEGKNPHNFILIGLSYSLFPDIFLSLLISLFILHLLLCPRSEFKRTRDTAAGARHQCRHSGQPRGSHAGRLPHLWAVSMCEYPLSGFIMVMQKGKVKCWSPMSFGEVSTNNENLFSVLTWVENTKWFLEMRMLRTAMKIQLFWQ